MAKLDDDKVLTYPKTVFLNKDFNEVEKRESEHEFRLANPRLVGAIPHLKIAYDVMYSKNLAIDKLYSVFFF